MNKSSTCPICDSKKLKTFPAKLFPFILDRIKRKDPEVGLVKCRRCDFVFCGHRFSDEEMVWLYHNYRDEVYQKCREKHEELYTKEFNDAVGKSEEEIAIRIKNLSTTIKEAKIDMSKIESVLDFGGDKGQHINIDIFSNQKKYLYEITDLELAPGVERVSQLENDRFDFIVSQHVLEHVSYPMKMMKQIVASLKNNGYFYFELPFENIFPTKKSGFFRKISEKFWDLPYFFDLSQKKRREKGKFLMIHEHINFFNEESVKKMISIAGLKLLHINTTNPSLIFGVAQKC